MSFWAGQARPDACRHFVEPEALASFAIDSHPRRPAPRSDPQSACRQWLPLAFRPAFRVLCGGAPDRGPSACRRPKRACPQLLCCRTSAARAQPRTSPRARPIENASRNRDNRPRVDPCDGRPGLAHNCSRAPSPLINLAFYISDSSALDQGQPFRGSSAPWISIAGQACRDRIGKADSRARSGYAHSDGECCRR